MLVGRNTNSTRSDSFSIGSPYSSLVSHVVLSLQHFPAPLLGLRPLVMGRKFSKACKSNTILLQHYATQTMRCIRKGTAPALKGEYSAFQCTSTLGGTRSEIQGQRILTQSFCFLLLIAQESIIACMILAYDNVAIEELPKLVHSHALLYSFGSNIVCLRSQSLVVITRAIR